MHLLLAKLISKSRELAVIASWQAKQRLIPPYLTDAMFFLNLEE